MGFDKILMLKLHIFLYDFTDVFLSGLTQTVRLLSVSVALTVITVTRVTGAHHSAKMVSALLLTGGASANIIVWKKKGGKSK